VNISETLYYSFGGDTVGMRVDGELSWIFGDQFGSTGVTYKADGSGTVRQSYYPFGGIRNPGGAPVVATDVGFTGQRLDETTGLMFYQARYYDPLTARFISADTMIPDPGNPQDFNRYSYVRNNPLGYTDPSGNDPCPGGGGGCGGVLAGGDGIWGDAIQFTGNYRSLDVAEDDVVVVWGSLDAGNVIIHFPGTGNGIRSLSNSLGDAQAIYDAATALDPDTAVVLWLCYDVPSNLVAARLRSSGGFGRDTVFDYVEGLGLIGDQFVTASGHSFGARPAFTLFAAGYADQAVLAAPASLSADIRVAMFNGFPRSNGNQRRQGLSSNDSANVVYTGRAGNDLIRFVSSIYGTEFDVGNASGHSKYYFRDRKSLRSIAELVVESAP